MRKFVFVIILVLLFASGCISSTDNSNEDVDSKPTLHMIGLFHTVTNRQYSHCAFTAKVLKFSRMMHLYGWKIIEYGNGQTESGADEFVQIMTEEELKGMLRRKNKGDFYGEDADINTQQHAVFSERLLPALQERVKRYDLILHPFGRSHQDIVDKLPEQFHVESGIGYMDPFLNFKIFESYAKMHYNYGREIKQGNNYNWVVPNYFDIKDWDFSPTISPDRPIVFMGRMILLKGLPIIVELAKRMPQRKFKIAGQGKFEEFFHGLPNVEFHGPLDDRERNDFLMGAAAMILPTTYVEPFGGALVEAQLMGIPGITTDYGAFAETIEHGVTGFRCHTLGDFIAAIEEVDKLDRKYIRDRAIRLYSFEAVGKRYDAIFKQVYDLRKDGWFTNRTYTVHLNQPAQSACP